VICQNLLCMCHTASTMPQRSSKQASKDINEIAARILAEATDATTERVIPENKEKNPAAVALGRLGGKAGGKARAAKLTPERRQEIARRAANSRWSSRE
jgi:hypothetical protein